MLKNSKLSYIVPGYTGYPRSHPAIFPKPTRDWLTWKAKMPMETSQVEPVDQAIRATSSP